MGFGKFLGCVLGGAVAIVAAPVILPAAAAIGTAAAAAGTAAAGVAAAAGTAVASTAVGGAVVGAATAAGTAVAGAAAAAGTAVTGTAIGGAVVGAAATTGATIATTATAAGTAIASSSLVGAATALEVGVAGAIGSSLTYTGLNVKEGFDNKDEAEQKIKTATKQYNQWTESLELANKKTIAKLENLNKYKFEVYSNEIKKSIEIIKKIKVPKEKEIDFLDDTNINYYITKDELKDMESTSIEASYILKEVSNGVQFMQATASSTLTFVSQFGIASTGTAISSLNGAAAYNATIAALGGGALSVGGGGMALGYSVLGGITLLPTAVITSWNFAKNSQKMLTEATDHYSKVMKEIENIKTVISVLQNGINPRVDEISSTIKKLVSNYNSFVFPKLVNVYDRNKELDGFVKYKNCSENDKKSIKLTVYYLKKMKDVISVKVIDNSGNPSNESKKIICEIKNKCFT